MRRFLLSLAPLSALALAASPERAVGQSAAPSRTIAFTTREVTWGSLDISPDGQRILVELLGDLYTVPIGGGTAARVIAGNAFESQPRYAPDGRTMLYVSDATGSDNLWIANVDGTGAHVITKRTTTTMQSPAWSPDGRSIYVTMIESGSTRAAELWKVDVSSGAESRVVENGNGAPQPLVSSPSPGAYSAALSPDGAQLWYTSVTPRPYGSRQGATSSIMMRDLASGAAQRVPLDATNAMKPALSRDGRFVVFGAQFEGRTALRVRDLRDGTERWLHRRLQRDQLEARADRDVLPNYAITPDSKSVIIEIDGHLHRLGLEDASDAEIPFTAAVSMTVPAPPSIALRVDTGDVNARRISHLAIAPNGRIAFSTLARIFITKADGTAPTRLTTTVRPREYMPAWSRDGQYVAYVTWDEQGGRLWKARVDGKTPAVALSTTPAFWADPVFTPDGKSVIALTAPLNTSRQGPTTVPADARIVRVSALGASPNALPQVLGAAAGLRHPHMAADTTRVLLSSAQAGLVSMKFDGSDRRVEATLAGASELWLSPDSRTIAARQRTRVLRFAAPATAGAALVATSGTVLTDRDPTAVAFNGARVAFTRGMMLMQSRDGAASDSVSLAVALPRPRASGTLVLRGARVITMRGDEVVANADVVIANDRIASVGPRGAVPTGARVIDVTGKTIVPGFIDVHAHLFPRTELLEPEGTPSFASLAGGFTTVRDPQVAADIFALADVVEADGVPSPRMLSTGPGVGGLFANGGNLRSLDDARAIMRIYRDEYRTRYLKSYLAGTRQQRAWIAEAAREAGLLATTEGGADTKEDLTHVLDGYSGNEHAFPVAPIHDDLVQFVAKSGIAYTPTVVVSFGGALPIYRLLADERPHLSAINRWFPDGELYQRSSTRLLAFPPEDFNDDDVGAGAAAILRAGGLVALGGHGEVHGLSAHWEMQLLAKAGMTPHEVLRVATINGATALGLSTDIGSLEPGKLADLVVLDRNPLDDIRHTQSTRMVMRGGVLYDAATLAEIAPHAKPITTPWFLARPASEATLANVDRAVHRMIDSMRVPGAAVAVVRGSDVLLAKGYGFANLEQRTPVTPETMFESGSLGKQFTAAGVMSLVEVGKIVLDSSIRAYFPDAPASWQPITVRNLLNHSSGIPDYTGDQLDYRKAYSEADLQKLAYALPLEFAAGARWNYSNTGYVMLGILIHKVTGKPYWEYLRERIFTPAGMRTIRIISESEIVPHRAQGYLLDGDHSINQSWVSPELNTTADGSLLMSLRDMLAWNDVVRRKAVLSAASWNTMQGAFTLKSGKPYPYGMGWFVDSLNHEQVLQHSGAWQGFRTQFTRFAHGDLAVIVLGNSRTSSSDVIANEVAAILDPALRAAPENTTPIPDREPKATDAVRAALLKAAHNQLTLADFTAYRQTVLPRLQALLATVLRGLDAPTQLELLSRREVGDDVAYVYRASYGAREARRRFTVRVSLGPDGRLTGLLASENR